MLKVIVELHPYGDSRRKRVIGEMSIINDGTHDHPGYGNYVYGIGEHNGYIKNHYRDEGYLKLLQRIVNDIYKEEE